MQNGGMLVGQHHAAAECIERLFHPRPLDGRRVQHVADGHRAAKMRQQQLPELDLTLGDDAEALVPAHGKAGEARRSAYEEELQCVHKAMWLPALLTVWRCLQIVPWQMFARKHTVRLTRSTT